MLLDTHRDRVAVEADAQPAAFAAHQSVGLPDLDLAKGDQSALELTRPTGEANRVLEVDRPTRSVAVERQRATERRQVGFVGICMHGHRKPHISESPV